MKEKQLLYHDRDIVGILEFDGKHIFFEYSEEWIKKGFPISGALPLKTGGKRLSADNFIRNLFPEEKRRLIFEKMGRISPEMILPFLRLSENFNFQYLFL